MNIISPPHGTISDHCLKLFDIPSFLLCSLCFCTQTSNFCPIVGRRSRKLSPQLLFAPRISLHISAHFLWGRSMQRGAERPPYEHLCVSEITGWEWADGMSAGGEDDADEGVKKVITEGWLWRKWHRDVFILFFFFIPWYSRISADISLFLFCGYFSIPSSASPSSPPPPHYLACHLLFPFTCPVF